MNILVVSDSFKGSLTSSEICDIANSAILAVIPQANVKKIVLADGGEGSVEALVLNTEGSFHECIVTGPFFKKVKAVYGILGDYKTAIIEMSSASGIMHANKEELNPMVATSYGTGELILDAMKKGCKKIVIGIGGSATNDGGLGMLQALGFEFFDEKGDAVGQGGQALINVRSISSTKVLPEIFDLEIHVACDVNNPLIGEQGATRIYGPQKGGTNEMLELLEKGMINYGNVIENTFSKSILNYPGAGAAGGMGAGLLGILNGTLDSGFKLISDLIGLEEIINSSKFDYIFTGEGQINHQTLNGKLPFGVAQLGQKFGIPVIAVAGSIDKGFEEMYEKGLTSVFSIINQPMVLDEAIINAKDLLYQTYFNIATLINKSSK
ncbi:Glycerate kinase [Petrocella atlantisensis]|uniref:Glycerate kinase n=1 Tax=Petrocella atlantisensis TaxID=2173034 RepID=A0A3P7PWD1_9FIRM|nr:glycerate kinase [Petrocella atlantisensis]VDN47551.1 Glycerate kinase [Petrocella atlantisensis]